MSRVVLDCRHRASSMEGGPDERYHIRRIGCAQSDGLRGDRRERPRWGIRRGWRIREPARRLAQNGGPYWQASASPQLLLRSLSLRIWTSPTADRFGARVRPGGTIADTDKGGRPGQDRSPRRFDAGKAASRRRTDADLDTRR